MKYFFFYCEISLLNFSYKHVWRLCQFFEPDKLEIDSWIFSNKKFLKIYKSSILENKLFWLFIFGKSLISQINGNRIKLIYTWEFFVSKFDFLEISFFLEFFRVVRLCLKKKSQDLRSGEDQIKVQNCQFFSSTYFFGESLSLEKKRKFE